ncbi:GvpL/GvpF family gas vesicle protein [Geitlerinema sp. PCC 7407]|uniref:GvpL/GvpF family gas vesicle protein n=1 Tax=Geitlerinema sp. PCC 7407 TaxID=1173025 RepID=UPI00029F9163|nr:GvpL/GvpF family gas vesicle protein [Geitlerinema sp. PCC 7407]AFY67724.1 gas vesicle protein [Geitlerinema sp. PCC 7407]
MALMYVYALLPTPTTALALPPGFASAAVQVISQGPLAAIAEAIASVEALQQDDEHLMQAVLNHDRVIRSLFAQTSLLPLRFGTCLASEAALAQYLIEHSQEHLRTLQHLAGKAEYCLSLTPLEASSEPAIAPEDTTGKAYFLAKKQRYQAQADRQRQQAADKDHLLEAISQRYGDLRQGEPKAGTERVYLLVDRAQEPELQRQLQAWQTQTPHWSLLLGEALPPYHFL